MANVGDTIPGCSGTGTSGDPYKYQSALGFKNAIAVSNAYVEAAEENMVFDANDGILSATCSLYCKSLNGKGTIIRNLYANATDSILIAPKAHDYTYENINFYNMLIIINTSGGGSASFCKPSQSSGGNGGVWTNCNFTGVIKGTLNVRYYGAFSGYLGGGIYGKNQFKNCTFNINFNLKKTTNNNLWVFYSNSDYDDFLLDNCTINISGNISATSNDIDLYIVESHNTVKNCTFMNKQSNPLTVGTAKINVRIDPNSGSGYNYFKAYVTHNTSSSNSGCIFGSGASGFLVNTSRITGFTTGSGGIRMQETDTSANTYIYNAENLAANNFPVGTAVE